MDFWTIICFIIFPLMFLSYLSQKRIRDAVNNIPGSFEVPLIGSISVMFSMDPNNVLAVLMNLFRKYGDVMKMWAFNNLLIMSGDTELNEQVLASSTHITKHHKYGILHQWLGIGLLMSDGKKWHSRRKIITPTFHFKILEQFVEVFDQQSNILLECLEANADGKAAFNIYPYICSTALDIIAETAMGTKVHAQTDVNMQYTKAVNEATKLMAWRFMKPHLKSELIFSIMYPHLKRRQMKLIKTMHAFTRSVIEDRRESLQNSLSISGKAYAAEDDVGSKRRMALLDVLLQATIDGQPLSNEDIREEVDTFMFEGHDTTTSAISFALYLLSRHSQVQTKLLAEIHEIFGQDKNRPITIRDLNELKYMECIIKETLRLYPSVPIVGREINTDFKYKHSRLGEGILPAGSNVFIIIYAMMMDPKRYENVNDFLPERHYKSVDNNAAFSLIPFSAGPRNCIGQKFAMLEMKMILSKIVRQYQLLPLGEPVKPVVDIVMRSATGMNLGISKRL